MWSFSLLLWEIMSYGQVPFESDSVELISIPAFVRQGGRPSLIPVRSLVCNLSCAEPLQFAGRIDDKAKTGEEAWAAMTEIMQSCWSFEASDRPTFQYLSQYFGSMLESESEYLPPLRDVGLIVAKISQASSAKP